MTSRCSSSTSVSERPKSWWVYLVRCADNTLYCGTTNDLEARIAAHNAGLGARYTRGRGPVELLFRRRMGTRSAALIEEARIKRLPRAAKLALFSLARRRPRR